VVLKCLDAGVYQALAHRLCGVEVKGGEVEALQEVKHNFAAQVVDIMELAIWPCGALGEGVFDT
jgi:hypothetical protein